MLRPHRLRRSLLSASAIAIVAAAAGCGGGSPAGSSTTPPVTGPATGPGTTAPPPPLPGRLQFNVPIVSTAQPAPSPGYVGLGGVVLAAVPRPVGTTITDQAAAIRL